METKRQLVKEVYIKPCAKVFELAEKSFIMAVSPNVRPGVISLKLNLKYFKLNEV